MSLPRRLVPLAVGVLAAVALAVGIGVPAGASGSTPYNEQAILVLDRPAIKVEGTNTATIKGCKPGTEVPFVLRSWNQPGPQDNGLGDGTVWLGTAIVGADGSASLTFTLPSSIRPGTFAVKAMCDLPHGYSGWLSTRMQVTGARGPDNGNGKGTSRAAVEGAEVLSASAAAGASGGSSSSGGGSSSAGSAGSGGSSDAGSSPLARTGLDVAGIERLGVLLLALGGALVLVTRKRRLPVGL